MSHTRTLSQRPLLACILLALSGAPLWAAPATSHWTLQDLSALRLSTGSPVVINDAGQIAATYFNPAGQVRAVRVANGVVTDLGNLGGAMSIAAAINQRGDVTGQAMTSTGATHAFLYTDGAMLDLGPLGDAESFGRGINDAGQVAGQSIGLGGVSKTFVYGNGVKVTLPGLSSSYGSFGMGINNAGQVLGNGYNNAGAQHAFVYSDGVTTDLGTLGGLTSFGNAINQAGQVTGSSSYGGAGGVHAFITVNGSMRDLGTLGGVQSAGLAISDSGLVVGHADVFGGLNSRAFLYANGVMRDLNGLPGLASSAWSLFSAVAINNSGQIVAQGRSPTGAIAFAQLTLDTVVWESGAGGSWDATTGWSAGINPNLNTAVYIDPTRSLTVTGPTGRVTVRSLNVGGDATGNNGVATLHMVGGHIQVTGDAGRFTTVSAKGVLSGDGGIGGVLDNLGTVNASNLTLVGGLRNQGLVTGNGRLVTDLDNTGSGTLQVVAGQTLLLSGASHTNSGLMQATGGGSLRVAGAWLNASGGQLYVNDAAVRFNDLAFNASGGRIQVNGGQLRFDTGLSNSGQVLVTTGGAEVFGKLTQNAGGKLILSGNSASTFYDTVDVQTGAELRVAAGASATFFGKVLQRTGASFTGTGSKFYEGGLSIGASPGLGVDEGDVSFGSGSSYLAEIGGTTACTLACATDEAFRNNSHDKFFVQGHLALGGELQIASWQGFTAQAGMRFDLLDWGTQSGRFDTIDFSGLRLANGTRLDTSRLYLTGEVSVVAVPEPGVWALMLGGVGVVGWTRRQALLANKLQAARGVA